MQLAVNLFIHFNLFLPARMDNLALDMMLDEYEKGQKEAAEEIILHKVEAVLSREAESREPTPPPANVTSNSILSEETVPVSDGRDKPSEPAAGKESVESSSSSSVDFSKGSSGSSSGGVSSLYQPGFTAPTINYEKDRVDQKLIAIIGREFDQPIDIARSLQDVLMEFGNADSAKFVPFMVKRKTLLRGSFSTKDLGNHDLICLCYNASEARILLTGQDGFYTTLLKQIEALLGKHSLTWPRHTFHSEGCGHLRLQLGCVLRFILLQ